MNRTPLRTAATLLAGLALTGLAFAGPGIDADFEQQAGHRPVPLIVETVQPPEQADFHRLGRWHGP